jgi:hypothetical protein
MAAIYWTHEMEKEKQPAAQGLGEPKQDDLAKLWNKRIASARKHWEKFHRRVRHNRKTVSGIDWQADPETKDFYRPRANLIHGTITAVLPNIYARNPEISATPLYRSENLKLLCKTIETVTNRGLERAKLKDRAKATVRSALTSSFGIVKVMYQRDLRRDPIIQSRINDTQDNIAHIEGLVAQIEDPEQRTDQESKKAELEQVMKALEEQVEVVAAEGLVIDRVLTDNLLVDPGVCEFWDYRDADWMAQVIPMKKSDAEANYKIKLDKAKAYESNEQKSRTDKRIASGAQTLEEDKQIAIIEIWDKTSNRVLTMAEGCDFWLREPFSPTKVGERWYPFFLLPFQVVDGQFVGPSLVDLTEKLQDEHNESRDRFNKHRDLAIPGWVASGDISEKALKNFAKSVSVEGFGEITIVDTEGKPLAQVIQPRQHPQIDPAVYDTSAVRYDWEQVTGLQDAARSSVVKPKTATEASIMQQSLSGRVSEFRDQVEDWLQELSQYAAQILLMEMSAAQVERIMGPHTPTTKTVNGVSVEVMEKTFDWPELSRDQVFEMIEMRIRAGTTGAPDKLEQQESWTKVMPLIDGLIGKITAAQAQGLDVEPLRNLMRETIKRFDERLDIEQFMPKPPAPPMAQPGMSLTAPAGA